MEGTTLEVVCPGSARGLPYEFLQHYRYWENMRHYARVRAPRGRQSF